MFKLLPDGPPHSMRRLMKRHWFRSWYVFSLTTIVLVFVPNGLAYRSLDDSQGEISQESLTAMIRHDELTPTRVRRRFLYGYPFVDGSKVNYPHGELCSILPRFVLTLVEDALPVARWARTHFGTRSTVTAIFLTHAVINENTLVMSNPLVVNRAFTDGWIS